MAKINVFLRHNKIVMPFLNFTKIDLSLCDLLGRVTIIISDTKSPDVSLAIIIKITFFIIIMQ